MNESSVYEEKNSSKFTQLSLYCSLLYFFLWTFVSILRFYFRWKYKVPNSKCKTIAFLHPYANAGGGGERVLWLAVQAIIEQERVRKEEKEQKNQDNEEDKREIRGANGETRKSPKRVNQRSNKNNNIKEIPTTKTATKKTKKEVLEEEVEIQLPKKLSSLSRERNEREDVDNERIHLFIIHGDMNVAASSILQKALVTFGVDIQASLASLASNDQKKNQMKDQNKNENNNQNEPTSTLSLTFIPIPYRWLLEAKYYPMFTMVGQALGSMLYTLLVCLLGCVVPDVVIDTMGLPFAYPILKLILGCKVVAYVHYPTISIDMLTMVQEGKSSYNNNSHLANSRLRSSIKVIYYRIFAFFYSLCGLMTDVVMCNSSWTKNHIQSLWYFHSKSNSLPLKGKQKEKQQSKGKDKGKGKGKEIGRKEPLLVYPPCNTSSYMDFPLDQRQPWILSVSQFRPEKDHLLQLTAFSLYINKYKDKVTKLIMLGGVRNPEDQRRVHHLQEQAQQLKIPSKQFQLITDAPNSTLKEYLGKSIVGLHTMWNEHFGISVVEFMASGLLTLAHNSAGPKEDIVGPGYEGKICGFLASSENEYAEKINEILLLRNSTQGYQIQERARRQAQKFSEENFKQAFVEALSKFL